jgi:hypothetical protein
MQALRWFSVVVAIAALLAPAAHVLEMPNKLHMEGALWLEVQQQLYRGWGPFIGAPTEIGGVLVNALLAFDPSSGARQRRLRGLAVCIYLTMILVFFVFNAPVNAAVSGWTVTTLPADWADFRWKWELGHALAALLALAALPLVLKASGLAGSGERV